jgi:hypothetical protein
MKQLIIMLDIAFLKIKTLQGRQYCQKNTLDRLAQFLTLKNF